MNYREKLLFSALLIERWSGQCAFTRDDLIVAAWRCWPDVFGLADHPYPCSNRVVAKLYGPRGLIGLSLLRQTGSTLELSPEGRTVATLLLGPVQRAKPAEPRGWRPVASSPTSHARPGERTRTTVRPTRVERATTPPQKAAVPVVIPGPQRLMGMGGTPSRSVSVKYK